MKATKALAILSAAALLTSSAVTASAATAAETSGADKTGTIKFDPGDWEVSDGNLLFYIWDDTGDTTLYATKDGWIENDTFGSKKKTGGTLLADGTFESFEFTIPEGHDLRVVFVNNENYAYTYDCLLTEDALGDTARRTGTTVLPYFGAEKECEEVKFEKSGLTTPLSINDEGEVVGSSISKNSSAAKVIAQYVAQHLGASIFDDPFTTGTIDKLYSELGTTADEVWDEYCKLDPDEYWNYNQNAAKGMIRPTGYVAPAEGTIELIGFEWSGYGDEVYVFAYFVDLHNPEEIYDMEEPIIEDPKIIKEPSATAKHTQM